MRFYALVLLFALSMIPVLTQTKKGGTVSKPKAATPKPAAKKPSAKPTPKRPAAAATPSKAAIEKADWEKATVIEDARERIAALKKFLDSYPKTSRRMDALEIILKLRSDIGNERLTAGDVPAAVEIFKTAVAEAPTAVSDTIFNETLARFAPNLYFRGATVEAVELQRSIEKLAAGNVQQLFTAANFYLNIENGSEVLRVADELTNLKPDSAQVAQVKALGLRMQFQLDESKAAFSRAVELDPELIAAKRGLAEANRSSGNFDEALVLYREILTKEPTNIAAKTGIVLTMYDLGKRAEAEAEIEAVLKESPSNVILLAGAAYWYASNGVAEKAVELGKRAVEADPRFVWSHIAYARGLAMQNKLPEAEKSLIVARKYGNFPSLDLELALVRMNAGYYREAAETLDQSFAVEGDKVSADLGFRVRRSARDLVELTSYERRSSIFAFRPALDPAATEQLRALLEYSVMIEAEKPDIDKVVSVAKRFIGERDEMQPFRELYVASHFASKRIASEQILTLTRDVIPSVDSAVNARHAVSAILADEIYSPRTNSIANNEYVELPNVSKQVLTAILRGKIEEINGVAFANQGKVDDAVTRFRRSIGVLPVNSSWWRSVTWRLGTILDSSGKSVEALEQYYLSYRSGSPDPIKYAIIEATYRKVNGNTNGLVEKIGENPLRTVAVAPTPTPESTPEAVPTSTPAVSPEPTPKETPVATLSPTPEPTPEPTPKTETTPTLSAESLTTTESKPSPTPMPQSTPLFPPVVITIPKAVNADPSTAEAEIKPCKLTVSEEIVTLDARGSDLGLIVGTETDVDMGSILFKVSGEDVSVKREPIAAIKTRALFVLRSVNGKSGDYKVQFELPCGKKEIEVRVR